LRQQSAIGFLAVAWLPAAEAITSPQFASAPLKHSVQLVKPSFLGSWNPSIPFPLSVTTDMAKTLEHLRISGSRNVLQEHQIFGG
jgi:hypothetical protein